MALEKSSFGKETALLLSLIILVAAVLVISIVDPWNDDQEIEKSSRPLVLYTDFGYESYRVPQMLGYIYSVDSKANVVEATHSVSAFNIKEGAFLMYLGAQEFPESAVFVGVVSPGQTVTEHIVVELDNGQLFVAPDNGLLTYILDNLEVASIYDVTNAELFDEPLSEMSTTKITSQVGAKLADGYSPADLGLKITDPVKLTIQSAQRDGNALKGEIVLVDSFGNCISNLPTALIEDLGLQKGDNVTITIGTTVVPAVYGTTYGDVPVGDAVVFLHSLDLLELSINWGDFSDVNSADIGTAFSLEKA